MTGAGGGGGGRPQKRPGGERLRCWLTAAPSRAVDQRPPFKKCDRLQGCCRANLAFLGRDAGNGVLWAP
jgi:hypothetical protein